MSFTITPTLNPSRFAKIWRNRVVLPAPKNPERTVTGTSGLPVFAEIWEDEEEDDIAAAAAAAAAVASSADGGGGTADIPLSLFACV